MTHNPPFAARNNNELLKNILIILINELKRKTAGNDLKTIHILPGPKNLDDGIIPSVIVSFIYFLQKHNLWCKISLDDRVSHLISEK